MLGGVKRSLNQVFIRGLVIGVISTPKNRQTRQLSSDRLNQGCPFRGSRAPRGSLRVFAMALCLFENFLRMGLFTSRKDLSDGLLRNVTLF